MTRAAVRAKIIACDVFKTEIEYILKDNAEDISAVYFPINAHDQPDLLRERIQNAIDNPGDQDVELFIIAYGLCGNSLAGIRAGDIPLLVMKAHDCSQILLGTEAHRVYFNDNPSRGWMSRGFLECDEEFDGFRGGALIDNRSKESYIEEYGEENGEYIWNTMHPEHEDSTLYYIHVPETSSEDLRRQAIVRADRLKKSFKEIPGNIDMLRQLIVSRSGDDVLYVPPGGLINPSWNASVIKVEK